MTPERLAKIRALAEDPRADPATRAIARSMLEAELPLRPQTTNPLHPGMRTTPEYERFKRAMQGKKRY
jgi:hypothetical protein